jgi:uncharacterized membrane protein
VDDVNQFYNSSELGFALDFIEKYQVSYIILGQLERAKYDPEGISKFSIYEDIYWQVVYQDQETIIYETLLDSD